MPGLWLSELVRKKQSKKITLCHDWCTGYSVSISDVLLFTFFVLNRHFTCSILGLQWHFHICIFI